MSDDPAMNRALAAQPTAALVDWIHDTRYEDLSASTVAATKRFVLDTLGTGLAGTAMPGAEALVSLARRWGGAPEASLWGTDYRVLAQNAAMANAAVAHALDYDDTHDPSGHHGCVPVLPAVFAMAERTGADGRALLAAAAIGVDLGVRLALAVKGVMHRGFLPTTLCGVFGAAAGAGRLMGLDRAALRDALGLAYSQACGNRQALVDGALAKRIQPGFAAQAGVLAAEMAGAGISGARRPIEGIFGFGSLYAGGELDVDTLLADLGRRYEIENLTCKPYPCCSSAHPAINGILALMERHRLRAEEVEGVHVQTTQSAFDLVGRPFQVRDNPQVDAQFSNGYTVAVALLEGSLGIGDFAPDYVRSNVEAHRLAARVVTSVAPSLTGGHGDDRAVVEVRTRDGQTYRERVVYLKGSPWNPMSRDEELAKFRDCAAHAARPLPRERQEEIIARVDRLEESRDVGELVRLLAA